MAATESAPARALAALTSAALALPGLEAAAELPSMVPDATFQYARYQESGGRMRVDVYRKALSLPLTDRFELGFSVNRDTYSGATPAYSLPTTLTGQAKFAQRDDGNPASAVSFADVVSAASGGASAGGLTILGGLNAFTEFVTVGNDARARFITANPRPPSPPPPPTIPGAVTLGFENMALAAYAGKANLAPAADGSCPGVGFLACYLEGGIAVGIADDPSNPIAHLHRTGSPANRMLGYHADSPGVYLRALDGSAFSLDRLRFAAPLSAANPDSGGADVWEILGFSNAVNPALTAGNGTNYSGRVAYQVVPNGFDGTLELDDAFANVNAVWIHYKGYPRTPADGKLFDLNLDDVALSSVVATGDETAAQRAWALALERAVAVAQYRTLIERPVPRNARPLQRLQQQPTETRTEPVVRLRGLFDDTAVTLSGGISDEPDFKSAFGSLALEHTLNDGLTTLSVSYAHTRNRIFRGGTEHASHHADDPEHNPTDYPELDARSRYHSVSLGVGQVIDRNTVIHLGASHTDQRGYLSNPYKFVYVRGEITAEEYFALWQAGSGEVDWRQVTALEVVGPELFREVRPSRRRQWSASARINRHVPALDGSLHLDYRYYTDDWDVAAHVVGAAWYQSLPFGLTLTPRLRYYTQSRAEFYAPWFLAPRADGHYSSDYRLSGFGAITAGVDVTKRFTRDISLSAGIEYYTHQGGLKLGAGGEHDYADFDYTMAHAELRIALAGLAAMDAGGVHHHGAPGPATPAGVLPGHVLPVAGQFMLGYRYMLDERSGSLRRGGRRAGVEEIIAHACGRRPCGSTPTAMTMHMHMFHLMYAVADGFTMVVMPQLVDMTMDMAEFPQAPVFDDHAGGHTSTGLGDTQFGALARLFTAGMHSVDAALLVSAPTGAVDVTLDGTDDRDSLLQDYGMQLGSGTWDLRPSLTYRGHAGRYGWGAQLTAVTPLEGRNDSGWAHGDRVEASAWLGVTVLPGVDASVRGIWRDDAGIRGVYTRAATTSAPVDEPLNYGGRYWDLGFGVAAAPRGGLFAGHAVALEWLQPVASAFDGYQLERDGRLMASWSYHF